MTEQQIGEALLDADFEKTVAYLFEDWKRGGFPITIVE